MAADETSAPTEVTTEASKEVQQGPVTPGVVPAGAPPAAVPASPAPAQGERPSAGPVPPGALPAGADGDDEPPEPGANIIGLTLPVKQALDLRHERLTGYVSKYVPASGWGQVKSHMFEGELFFRFDRIMPEFQAHPLHEGEAVEFDVQPDDIGRAHAVTLKPVLGRKPQDCLGQRHRGYVRRFAERWGFLNAAAFDGDLFIHRDNLLPSSDQANGETLRNGQAVEFDVAQDDRGRAVAKQITTRALLRPNDWMGHRLRGFIRSFQGAWGFINSDCFAGDLFVHRDSLLAQCQNAQMNMGTVVEFDIERDHHRKGARNRLVARNVAVLGPAEQAALYPPPPAAPQPPPLDPYAPVQPPLPGVPQPPAYYGAPVPPAPDPMMGYGVPPPYPYPPLPYSYPPQPLPLPHMQPVPYAQPPPLAVPPPYGQPPYGQPPYMYGQPPLPQPQYGLPQPMPGGPLPLQPMPAPLPAGQPMPAVVQPQPVPEAIANAAGFGTAPQAEIAPAVAASAPAPGPAAVPVGAENQSQGLLHITMHDWEPDQPGQLFVTKGTLVNVSYKAAHGWVYAGTVQPGSDSGEPASEGWIPQAVVKRVSLCRVAVDWPAEGQATLGVSKGEIIAVSKEAERGWVYGERLGPKQQDKASDGWLPKKVLDYLQS